MRNILLLNDFSPEAAHALAYGRMMATHLNVNLLVWNIDEPRQVKAKVLVHAQSRNARRERPAAAVTSKGLLVNHTPATQAPVKTLQLLDTVNKTIHQIVTEQKVELIIRGVETIYTPVDSTTTRIMRNTCCPVLLVPQDAELKPAERMVYLTDLRYCRHQISNYLKNLATAFQSRYSIAHLSAGLPEPEANYAISMYEQIISHTPTAVEVTFNHIKEKNVKKAADVLIHTMQNDLMAMAYGRYHFKTLTDQGAPLPELEQTAVPLLLFPS
jgi:hypothetical protein